MSHHELRVSISIIVILLKSIAVLSRKDGSLIFVIDNTVSMADEIKQIQNSVDSIMDVILSNSSQIQNVVLVTFNDPDWSCPIQEDKRTANRETILMSKSCDREALNSAMKSITTHGGGDGPEYSFTGILHALEESNHNSYMFVFTDASPKDYQLKEDVKIFAQQKGTQIFFVLTPNCNEDEVALDPYYDVATATFGSVFRLEKETELQQIMNFVRETVSGERTILLAKFVPGGQVLPAQFTIDEQIEYIVILVSGENVNLTSSSGDNNTWLRNVKATKIKNPTRGDYKLVIGGRVLTSVIVYGVTNSTFDYGFFDKSPASMNETTKICGIGAEKRLAILANDDQNFEVESVQVTGLNGYLFRELQLKKTVVSYTTELFSPPNTTFLIAVKGKLLATGAPVVRTARTPTTPNIVAPKIEETPGVIFKHGKNPQKVSCRIKNGTGRPVPKIQWMYKSFRRSDFKVYGESSENKEVIAVNKVGYYRCNATNIAGFDEKTFEVTLAGENS